MSLPSIAFSEVYNYEIQIPGEEGFQRITDNQSIELIEGEDFRFRITKEGSDAYNFGGSTYWHISSDQDYSSVWADEITSFSPNSSWYNGDTFKISNGIYLPSQDSGTNGLHSPEYAEYIASTIDDAFSQGDIELNVYFSLDKDNIVLEDTHGHSFSGGEFDGQSFTVSEELTSENLRILIKDNDHIGDNMFITGPSGVEGISADKISSIEKQDFVYNFDANKQVTWSIDGDDENHFEIDHSTGVLSFKDAPSFLSQASRNGDNIYELEIKASLENGSQSTQSLQISVEDDPSDNFGSVNTFGPDEAVIRLSSGNGWNTLLSETEDMS